MCFLFVVSVWVDELKNFLYITIITTCISFKQYLRTYFVDAIDNLSKVLDRELLPLFSSCLQCVHSTGDGSSGM